MVADWLPRFYTARKSDHTDGGFVADFGASFLHVSKGVQAGHPLVVTDWQRWLLDGIYDTVTGQFFARHKLTNCSVRFPDRFILLFY